jgi:ankyrin repeat protein
VAILVPVLLACSVADGSFVNLSTPKVFERAPDDVVSLVNAIDRNDMRELETLLESGARATPPGSPLSPIHAAITHFSNGRLFCNMAALDLLLKHGADPNFIDNYTGFAPLEEALAMGDLDCARSLRKAGSDPNIRGRSGQSILQFAVKGAVRTNDTALLGMVLDWGVDRNVLSYPVRWTALHVAAAIPNAEFVVADLLARGVDPCIKDQYGITARDVAAVTRNPSKEKLRMLDGAGKCKWRHL